MSGIPWRGTTEDIATEADSRYETPGGAQAKVDISQEYLLQLLKLAVTGLSNGSEAAIARYSEPYDITYDWLKDRLDAMDRREKQLGLNVKFMPFPYPSAVGDNVTSDSLSIQSAIDIVSAGGGGVVYVPNGSYLLTSTITLKTGVSLVGLGISDFNYRQKGTWLVANTGLDVAVQVGDDTTGFQVGCRFSDINITRKGFTNGSEVTGVGLWERNSISFNSENIFVEGFAKGILIGDLAIGKRLNHYYVNTNISECDVFINIVSVGDVTFNGGRIGTNAGNGKSRDIGVKVEGNCDSITFNRLIIAHNALMDYNAVITNVNTSLYWVTFNDCDLETATVNTLLCDTNATMIRINNSWVGSSAPMLFTNGDRIVIRDCTFATQNGLASVIHVSGVVGNVVIEDNDFNSDPNTTILVDTNSANVTIKNNLINGGGIGIRLNTMSGQGKNLIILGNKISNQGDNGISLLTTNFKNIKVSQNIIEDYVNTAILAGGGTNPAHLSIQDNVLSTSKVGGMARGVNIYSAISNVMIVNNDMSANTSPLLDSSVIPKVVANNL